MINNVRKLVLYEKRNGKAPFEQWWEGLKDRKVRVVIRARLDRLECGNAGMCKSIGGGVYELKIYLGPGYRVYFGEDGKTLIVLLCGGDKDGQERDIQKAQEYWTDYKERK